MTAIANGRNEAMVALKKHVTALPQTTLETTHLVHGSMYARTIFIPAGLVLVGAKTKIENICIVSGDITVSTDAGVVRLTGYHVIPANAGYSRGGFAHADTYWTTLLPTDLHDVDSIEDAMTDESNTLQTRKSRLCGDSHKTIEA